jgi:hypothetical protein
VPLLSFWCLRAATLYASIAISVTLLIFLAIAANSSDSDNRGGYGRRGGIGFSFFPDFWLLSDDPHVRARHRRRGAVRGQRGANAANPEDIDGEQPADVSLSFMQAVTSWVFGDGDPNRGFDAARWAAAAAYIQAHGGVVAAEEMRPFLDHAGEDSAAGVRGCHVCAQRCLPAHVPACVLRGIASGQRDCLQAECCTHTGGVLCCY